MRSLVLGLPRAGVPELVVLPGLGALGYLLPALRLCAQHTRVHLLDLPGFGNPRTARCPASLQDTASAAAAWVAGVPAAPVVLVGHSTGAQAALHVTASQPHAVAGLVLAGPTFPPAARRPAALLLRVLRTLPHESGSELPRVLPEYLRGGSGLVRLLVTSLRDRPEDLVGRVRVPVLVVRGRHDHLCDAGWAERLASSAPHGRAVEVPGGHNTPTTHPGSTAAAWCTLLHDTQL